MNPPERARGGPSSSGPVLLADLVHDIGGTIAAGDVLVDPVVRRVVEDHREASPGDLFVALQGGRGHGVQHAAAAIKAGAVAVLTDRRGVQLLGRSLEVPVVVVDDPRAVLGPVAARLQGHPAGDLTMLGITGTNGKTTTAYLLEAALVSLGRRPGLLSSPETVVGDRRRHSAVTTPAAPRLQELLAQMRDAGNDACVMEVSSHALDQHRVDGIHYSVVAFTNLTHEHLDYHGDMASYFAAKARLFGPEFTSRAVVVVDDDAGRRLRDLAGRRGVPVVSLANDPGVDAQWHIAGERGEDAFLLQGPAGSLALRTPLPGEHNRTDTAVAALMLLELGVSPSEVTAALDGPVSVPGRMEHVDLGPGWPTVVVDFAHTPDALASSAAALRARTRGRLVVTASSGGDRDPTKREPAGVAAVESGADVVLVTDDNPRTEDPAAIRAAVLRGVRRAMAARRSAGLPVPEVYELRTRREAIRFALEATGPDGTVVLNGRGHEQWMEIGPRGSRVPFVDRDEVLAAAAAIALARNAPRPGL
ncbi:UDP-N-acetylmuramoyl-L-alanyl-D-glutamate--2,6-diaminopimelate ligase [Kocuria rosea]|uniref:UDP-N-acetylmuramoyl-L-alanyl-D-glutamate--2,6-diaminopimelate ligase n=1 Tax=Kocuria rosea TaxID=1275 RepID=A0A4R5Y2K0_KOCRO|nr:UDP-N-acetylmuramoyl-L-alanyl-D-glutamate--2,6-diaminopimelate ligase [Kocuria rosea]